MSGKMIADRRIRALGARLVIFMGMFYIFYVGASFGFNYQYFVQYNNDIPAMTIALVFNLILALTVILLGISLANRKKGILPVAICVVVAVVAALYFDSLPENAYGIYGNLQHTGTKEIIAFAILFVLHCLHALYISLAGQKTTPIISGVLAIATVVCSLFAYIQEDILGVSIGFYATHIGLTIALFVSALGQNENMRANVEVQTKQIGKKAIIAIFAVVIVATFVMIPISLDLNDGMIGSATQKTQNEDSYGHDKFDAIVIAEKTVKKDLKSPSTAKFCKSSEYTVTRSGNTWIVEGWVDAQNSFGATIRNNFTVKFSFSSSEKYLVHSCIIE